MLAVLVGVGAAGCTTVTGGAVELSWKLRPSSGFPDQFLQCDSSGVIRQSNGTPVIDTTPSVGNLLAIRLHWEVDAIPASQDFACTNNQGVTKFDVPAGNALLSITPLCGVPDTKLTFEAAANSYTAPAPVQREVIAGDTVTLGALELVLQVTTCTPTLPCICQ